MKLAPKLKQHIKIWRCSVDDTFVYVKNGSIEYVLSVLESFHFNIKFTYEKEVNNTLPFLDVLFIRNSDHIHTNVYRKETNNDLYLYWHAFTPISWKSGALRTLVNRAYIICSDNKYLQQELKHLEREFQIQNGYPLWIIKQIMKEVKENKRSLVTAQNDTPLQNTNNDRKIHSLMLPFAGAKGNTMLKSMNRCIKRIVPNDVNTRITYTGHKLNTRFQIKDKTAQIHKHDLVYCVKSPDQSCNQDYLGETGCRIIERTADHSGKDKNSHLFKHACNENHKHIDLDNIKVIDSGYHNNRFKRKIFEALYIKQYKPMLNTQEQSIPLKLFN